MAAGQLLGHRGHLAGQFAVGDDRAGEGHGTDEDAEEQLDLEDVQLDRGLVRDQRGEGAQMLIMHPVLDPRRVQRGRNARHDCGHVAHLEMGIEAHEDGREAHQRVHRGDQLGHAGHLDLARDIGADQTAGGDQHHRQKPHALARADQRCEDRQRHADDAVPDRALGAFLAREAAQRQDEEDSRDHIGRRGKSEFHDPRPLTISGTWRACAG